VRTEASDTSPGFSGKDLKDMKRPCIYALENVKNL